ncbi:hypothetical protein [Nocardia sp. CA-290969]|uniref:hypothetical protein n=1 Tax=Nocardia sp. CA-290969 TaxID=3239986 RepID=UPI003D8C03A1
MVDAQDEDPLYRRLMSHPDEMALLQRKLTPEAVAAAGNNGMAELAEIHRGQTSASVKSPGMTPGWW